VWAQSGNSGTTHVVLTNDQHFLVSNGKFLSGVYECSDGGYIDSSCIVGHFPEVACPAGYAIQVIGAGITPATCVLVGSGGGPAGADTYVQYNAMGIFGADQNFTWNYTNSILTLGGGGPGEATFSGDLLANLGAPSNGTIAYCSNCNAATSPCTTTGTPHGTMAQYINGAWDCFGGSGGAGTVTGTGTTTHLAKWTSSTAIGDAKPTDNGTTLTLGALDLSYSQALYITGIRSISTSVSANTTDRVVLCTSGSSSDKTYTMPAPTGSGRILDLIKVDTGTNACIIGTASGNINAGTIATISVVWGADTCMDVSSGHWQCRGNGAVT
jgi:hypothetical protein